MLMEWLLESWGAWQDGAAAIAKTLLPMALALAAGIALRFILARYVVGLAASLARRTRVAWDDTVIRHGALNHLATLGGGLLFRALGSLWLAPESIALHGLLLTANFWILIAALLTLYALLDAVVEIYNTRPYARQMPIRGFVQGIKLVVLLAVLVVVIAMLMGKSPTLLVSGMGALTAVLMLIFKDAILGFVAGIQLSANRMLSVGDWLEMPRYQADGDVIDITLTTVKVRNWDQTITTIPTYALISESFKNWRGMQEIGGRRIARSLLIDMQSVRFLTPQDIERLRKAQLLTRYIDDKLDAIERHNREAGVDPASPVNGRRLTNLGTFRAYLTAYIKAHPGIHPDLIAMVRQLQPTPEGLPIQIYCFTRDTAWVQHEGVQADVFDHVLAVIPEFGLRAFQLPSGIDLRELRGHPAARATRSDGAAET